MVGRADGSGDFFSSQTLCELKFVTDKRNEGMPITSCKISLEKRGCLIIRVVLYLGQYGKKNVSLEALGQP